jgi:uncharacterized glyoxalase superfamily protein PhnB
MPSLTREHNEAAAGAAESLHGVVPHLTTAGATKAIDFYRQAFGAEEIGRHMADDGKRVLHAHLRVNGGDLFLHDDFPEYRGGAPAPEPAFICMSTRPTAGGSGPWMPGRTF